VAHGAAAGTGDREAAPPQIVEGSTEVAWPIGAADARGGRGPVPCGEHLGCVNMQRR